MAEVAIITGGSRGIGLAVAKQLADRGFSLVLVSSSPANLASARMTLQTSGADIVGSFVADFADLGSVAKLASDLSERDLRWDRLINNAGIKIQDAAQNSVQGFERHMAINHLAHFALTADLLGLANPRARVSLVSSIVANRSSASVFTSSGASDSYAASKLANLGFAIELSERLRKTGMDISANAAHPGFTMADPYGTKFTRLAEMLLAQSVERGAGPIVEAAVGTGSADYLGPKVLELWGNPAPARIPALARDADWRAWLWRESVARTGAVWPF